MVGIEIATGELMTSPTPKMDGGLIPKGYTCPYNVKCGDFQNIACNGQGCPVGNGRSHVVDFSCALARGFEICDK